jgi:hypothetical protein
VRCACACHHLTSGRGGGGVRLLGTQAYGVHR